MVASARARVRHVAIEGLGAEATEPELHRCGELIIVGEGNRLVAIDAAQAAVRWERRWPQPGPAHYQVPRRTFVHGRRLWSDGERLVWLTESETGAVATAHRARTGEPLWRRELPTPPPAPWTEAEPAWPGARTEELTAFVLADDLLAVAVARTTRRSMMLPGPPLPALRAQLDLQALDPATGAIRAEGALPDVHVPILEHARCGRWLRVGHRVMAVDPAVANMRSLVELAGEPSWPRAVGGDLAVAWRTRGQVHVARVDARSGTIARQAAWKRTGVKTVDVRAIDGGLIVQLGDQIVVGLDDTLAPRWEARVKPYVYDIAAVDEVVVVATAGNGGGLYGFDRASGQPGLAAAIAGGVWQLAPLPARGAIVGASAGGAVIARADREGLETVALAGARCLAAIAPDEVAVVSGAPAPGVSFVRLA